MDDTWHTAGDLFRDAAQNFDSTDPFFDVGIDDAKRGLSKHAFLKFLQKKGFISIWENRCKHKDTICGVDVTEGHQIKILKNLPRDADMLKELDATNVRSLKAVIPAFTNTLENEFNKIIAEKRKKMAVSAASATLLRSQSTPASGKASNRTKRRSDDAMIVSRSSKRLIESSQAAKITPLPTTYEESILMEEDTHMQFLPQSSFATETQAIIDEFEKYSAEEMRKTKKQRMKEHQNEFRLERIEKAFPKAMALKLQTISSTTYKRRYKEKRNALEKANKQLREAEKEYELALCKSEEGEKTRSRSSNGTCSVNTPSSTIKV